MAKLNRVQLIGNLGRDPESHMTPTGKKVCTFSVAVSRRRRGEGDKDAADWFFVETWERLAEICEKYLSKGRLVFIEGRLHTDRYEHEGETRYSTKVIASQMMMLDRPDVEAEVAVEEPTVDIE